MQINRWLKFSLRYDNLQHELNFLRHRKCYYNHVGDVGLQTIRAVCQTETWERVGPCKIPIKGHSYDSWGLDPAQTLSKIIHVLPRGYSYTCSISWFLWPKHQLKFLLVFFVFNSYEFTLSHLQESVQPQGHTSSLFMGQCVRSWRDSKQISLPLILERVMASSLLLFLALWCS